MVVPAQCHKLNGVAFAKDATESCAAHRGIIARASSRAPQGCSPLVIWG
jgi:hypothetical protein